ncbi:hypothetical protein ACHAWU_000104 [Discostella pseudostelligera]|uniref:TFA2 Winged helix domain-containing protein n=1 Tax=Discostella pseudostelligera TaxID=259834 RepID=A0ABD3MHJ1_9STRA
MAGTNTYGFDFLRAEHNLPNSNNGSNDNDYSSAAAAAAAYHRSESTTSATSTSIPNVSHKSNLEKQADILLFLKHHRSSGCLPPSVIYKSLGIDLTGSGENNGGGGGGDDGNNSNSNNCTPSLVSMLLSNPKIKVEEIPDPENPNLTMYQFGYRAKFSMVHDKATLLAQINRMKNGIKASELVDAYDNVEKDIQKLITSGEVLGVYNPEEKDKILFPRGESFLVELDGCISLIEEMAPPPPAAPAPAPAVLPPPPLPATAAAKSEDATTTDPIEKAIMNTLNNAANASTDTTTTTPVTSTVATAALPKPKPHSSSRYIHTDIDPQPQIRRGEAIRIGGEWFRISSQIIPHLPLEKQPPRAQAPLSVVSLKELSKKNEVEGYCYKFNATTIPLDGMLNEGSVGRENLIKAKVARERLQTIIASGGSVVIGGGVGGESSGSIGSGAGVVGRSVITGKSSATLLSSLATEKSPSMLAVSRPRWAGWVEQQQEQQEGVVLAFGGTRKLPTAKIHVRRPGDRGGQAGGIGSPSTVRGVGGGGNNPRLMDADAIKAAVEYAKKAASDPSLSYTHAIRHGCTKDVREMYLETLSLVPTSESELHKALLEHKLIEPGEKLSRPRMKRKNNVDNDGKPQKRRYYERKNMRRTNTHLDGTEIGAMLALAAEKQARGKSVGDGGM